MSADDLVLPGFANCHSHAFQRLLRGAVQRRDPSRADSFWTWRDQMYRHALTLDLEGLAAAARRCYVECLEAGYTAVGEFHYLHHAPDGAPWPDPLAAARVHLAAARDAGIRLTLLWCVYARGGIYRPLEAAQRRFATLDLDAVERALDGLAADAMIDGVHARVGLALHSVRAVPREWLAPLVAMARARALPIHVHASEQPAEVEQCRAAYGRSPIALLADEGVAGPDVTLVHATWIDDDDLRLIASSGTRVALCPTTEADLGDGIARVADLFRAGVPLCIGSDSHAIIDPLAELRMCEQLARLQTRERCVLSHASGAVAPALEAIGSAHGYASLALPSDGDRVHLRADDRTLEGIGAGPDDRRAAVLTSGHRGMIDRVEVAGRVVVDGGRHVAQAR